jgi:hypothetical protein
VHAVVYIYASQRKQNTVIEHEFAGNNSETDLIKIVLSNMGDLPLLYGWKQNMHI